MAQAAEVTKLARLLGVDEDQLAFLGAISADALREFRAAATDRLFASDGDKLKRVASAAKLVPAPIAAKAASAAFGPLLTAAVAGAVEPSRGIAIATNLPVSFLAKTTIAIDPRRATAILSQIPPKLAGKVAAELISMGEHLTLGRFVGVITDDALMEAAAHIDDADLLKVAFLLEDRGEVDRVVGILSDRLPGILQAAADDDLWAQAFGLLDSIGDAHKATMGDLTADLDPDSLASLVVAARASSAWATLLPVTRAMSIGSLRTFASNSAVQEHDTVAAVMDAALEQDLWLDLLPLAGELPVGPRTFLAGRIAALDIATLDDLLIQTDEASSWEALVPLAAVMTGAQVSDVLSAPLLSEEEEPMANLLAAADGAELPDDVREVLDARR